VAVFLGVIALSALLQAIFIIGLAVTSRMAHRRLRDLEERLQPQLADGVDRITRLTVAVSRASEQARLRALRLDATAARLANDLGDMVGAGADRVEDLASGTAEGLAGRLAAPSEVARRPFFRALALMRGLQRGLAVWRGQVGP
jgi:hypothetical protein